MKYIISFIIVAYGVFILVQGILTKFKNIKFNPYVFLRDLIKCDLKLKSNSTVKEDSDGETCTFLGGDIYNKRVYKNNKTITDNIEIECDKCAEYTYKNKDGCSPYMYDYRYAARGKSGDEYLGVCTSTAYPKPCKNQNSSSNVNDVSSNLP